MTIQFAATMAAPAVALAALAVGASNAPVSALPYGPDTCIQGYVWREARAGDVVCVTPGERSAVAGQNANPGANRDPNAGYGPFGCAPGFVWREAFGGDTLCVTPAVRSQMLAANQAQYARKAINQALPPLPELPEKPPPPPGYQGAGGGEVDIGAGGFINEPCSPSHMAPPEKFNTQLCMLEPP